MNAFETGDFFTETETSSLLHVKKSAKENRKRNGIKNVCIQLNEAVSHHKCLAGVLSSLLIVLTAVIVIVFGTEGVLSKTRSTLTSPNHVHSAMVKTERPNTRQMVEKLVDINQLTSGIYFDPLLQSQTCTSVYGSNVGFKHVEYVYASPSEELSEYKIAAQWKEENKGMIIKRSFEEKETKSTWYVHQYVENCEPALNSKVDQSQSKKDWVELERMNVKTIGTQRTFLDWKLKELVPMMEMVTLTFAIKQQNSNQENLVSEVLKVSDPKSESYGKYWTYAQVHDYFKPSSLSIQELTKYLVAFGVLAEEIQFLTPNGDWLRVTMTVWQANALLNAKFAYWENTKTGKLHVRVADTYMLPSIVAEHVDFVSPGLHFPLERHTKLTVPLKMAEQMNANADLDPESRPRKNSVVYPSVLRNLYWMPQSYKGGQLGSLNGQAVASFLMEWYNDDDLVTFWDDFHINATVVVRYPPWQFPGDGAEAELDVQYLTAMGEKIPTIVMDVEDNLYFLTLLNQMSTMENPPRVVSMSYGGGEQYNTIVYCGRANIEFAKVALMGITFLASSGDSGATDSHGWCDDGHYVPNFPASSMFVTAVGGVQGGLFTEDVSENTMEEVWYFGGGGFSWFFPRPKWQNSAVGRYLNSTLMPLGMRWNQDGKAMPDISLQAVDYAVCIDGGYYAVSGTSASCPTFAGMLSVINDYRLAKGKPPLGFVSPALYYLFDKDQDYYYNDVTKGHIQGCVEEGGISFYSARGWDAASGVGTPKFSRLFEGLVDLDASTI